MQRQWGGGLEMISLDRARGSEDTYEEKMKRSC